jgi:hypothetical protein
LKINITLTDDNGKKYFGSMDLTPIKSGLREINVSSSSQRELKTNQMPENIIKKIVKNLKTINAPHLVVIILKFHGRLTKSQQLTIFKKLGKGTTTFNGGNYTRDIVKKGLVHEVGKIGKEPVYDLTEKGKEEANNMIKKLNGDKDEKK